MFADAFKVTLKGTAEAFRLSLVKTPKYRRAVGRPAYVDPPRTMGDGFEVLHTADLDFLYEQDIPGLVPPTDQQHQPPLWSCSCKLGRWLLVAK